MNLYCLEDVAKHNGQNSTKVWVVIKNCVYDVTVYMKEHPGGEDLMLEFAGKDGTKGFNDFGHSSDAKNIMKKYKIGELVEDNNCKGNRKIKEVNQESEKSVNKNRRSILTKFWLCT